MAAHQGRVWRPIWIFDASQAAFLYPNTPPARCPGAVPVQTRQSERLVMANPRETSVPDVTETGPWVTRTTLKGR
jgi:hypothetical protein